MDIINLYKQPGETPLQCLARFVAEHPEYKDARLTYLGRLDPLAEGVLLVAPGSLAKETREEVLALPKEYVAEVLLGFATDTYDILGRITDESNEKNLRVVSAYHSMSAIGALVGERIQIYPAYSSKPVLGKPLFQWAREGKIDEIDVPTRNVEVHTSTLERFGTMPAPALLSRIETAIARVEGDFRQKKIIADWQRSLGPRYRETCAILTIRFVVSSGTYIRALAHELGKELGVHACLLHLTRTRVGSYTI